MTRIYFELAMPEFVGSFDATRLDSAAAVYGSWDVEIRTYADDQRTTFRLYTLDTEPWVIVALALDRYRAQTLSKRFTEILGGTT